MTYIKQTWNDGIGGGTPLSAARLNYIEDGLEEASLGLENGTLESRTASSFAVSETHKSLFGNGVSKPLSAYYASLALAQVDYPSAVGLTDELDQVILEKAIVGCHANTNPITTKRRALYKLEVGPGFYYLNRSLEFISLEGFIFQGAGKLLTRFRANAAMTHQIEINGCSYSNFSGFWLVNAVSTTNGIFIHSDPAASLNLCTSLHLIDIFVTSVFTNAGIAVGTDNSLQNDNITFTRCGIQGQWTAGNVTTFQYGWQVGPGGGSNTLDIHFYSCTTSFLRRGWYFNGAPGIIHAMQTANNGNDVEVGTPSGEYHIVGGRSEGAERLFYSGAGGASGTGGNITIQDIQFRTNLMHSDGNWIVCANPGLLLINVHCNAGARMNTLRAAATKIQVLLNQPGGGNAMAIHCSGPELPEEFFTAGNNPRLLVAYNQINDLTGNLASATSTTNVWASGGKTTFRGSTTIGLEIQDIGGNVVGRIRTDTPSFVVGVNQAASFQADTVRSVVTAEIGNGTATRGALSMAYAFLGLAGGEIGLFSGDGAPAFPNVPITPVAGDYYFRRDTPTVANQRIYVYTTTWVGIV